jgi:hypothetical protein
MSMTPTDESFEKANPGYYVFDQELYRGHCRQCGRRYECHLELNQFCSRPCQNKFLQLLTV